jgi:phage shock protein PspC (stress-responsive transcriptional regulator)
MTTTPPDAPSGPPPSPGDPSATGPRVDRDQVRDLGRLRRSVTDRKVAGVAGGLARHLDIDPLVLRVAFVVLVFFGGAGLILYGAAWLLVPEDGAPRAPFNLDERSRTVALVVAGVIAACALVGDSWGAFWFPWPVAVVALVAIWLLTRNGSKTQSAPPPGPYPPYPPYQGTHPPAVPDQHNPYSATVPPSPSYASSAPPPYVPPVPVRTPNPRKRGPILFWFTLALVVLCEGILGMVDLAGASVADSAYPALAVGIIGVMLVVGAFFGRAGGLIVAGLIATIALVGSTASEHWDGERIRETPTAASAVDSHYSVGVGELVLDLSEVEDVDGLDGRTIRVEGGVGRIEVIVPDDLGADVEADVDGPGHIELFGVERGGIDTAMDRNERLGADDPVVTIDAEIGVGEIEVKH